MNLENLNDKKFLRVQNLSCQRNNKTIFSNLTFELQPGSYLEIKGPNGSGKSSLLKTLAGLLPRSGGEIIWPLEEFRQFVYLGHKTGIQSYLTAVEHLRYWMAICARIESGKIQGASKAQAINQALEFWQISELSQKLCQEFSAGQSQRLALAGLQLSKAKLWILDEPCNALDSEGVLLFEQCLTKHLESGGSAIIVSHIPLRFPAQVEKQIIDIGINIGTDIRMDIGMKPR